ncbi:fructose-bisphosphate aldolase [Micromonospora sp. KC721]|nr:fructose-bisphosphate aldolase [Micromonospora sp. KC721]
MYDARKAVRLTRLSRRGDARYLFVPLDHSVTSGPIAGRRDFDHLVRKVVDGGADGIVLHKGRVRALDPHLFIECSIIVHLSASTVYAPDSHEKVLVGEVEEAVRIGADAVSIHVNVGSLSEAAQLADFGAVAAACDRWSIPLMAMMYPSGPGIPAAVDATQLAHLANIAVDLGADIVKTPAPQQVEDLVSVVASCPIPIVVGGGQADGRSLLDFAGKALAAGCRGLAIGRRVFQDPEPDAVVRSLATLVHPRQGRRAGSGQLPEPAGDSGCDGPASGALR